MEQQQQNGYRSLVVWQKADELAFQVYLITKNFPKEEMFSLTSQMRRASLSVPANIVEGYGRNSQKEKFNFYNIAKGSLTEIEYYIDFSFRLKYINQDSYIKLVGLRNDIGRLLNGLMKSIKL